MCRNTATWMIITSCPTQSTGANAGKLGGTLATIKQRMYAQPLGMLGDAEANRLF